MKLQIILKSVGIKNSDIKSKILEVNSNDQIEKIFKEWEINNEEDELV